MDFSGRHLGLKTRAYAHIRLEHERLRLALERNTLRFKQPEARPSRGLRGPLGVSPGTTRGVISAPQEKPAGSPLAAQVKPLLPRAQGGRSASPNREAAEARAEPLRLREFYGKSLALRRPQPPLRPPAIAAGAGTSRPLLLTSPPARRGKARVLSRAAQSTPLPISKPAEEPQRRKSAGKPEPPLPKEVRQSRTGDHSSMSSVDINVAAALLQRRVRIHPHFQRQSSSPSVEPRKDEAETCPQPDQESPSEATMQKEQPSSQTALVMPKLVQDVVASLHSEAQLTSDRIFKELVWSILGPTCDFAMEVEDVCLRKTSDQKAPEEQADLGLQFYQQYVSEELQEAQSSHFQLDSEDAIEWGLSEAESMLRFQETLEILPASESSNLVESEQPTSNFKSAKRMSLKKEPELLHIRGKGIKHGRRGKLNISEERRRKPLKFLRREKLQIKRIPGEYTLPSLHALCRTVPSNQLPFNLSLASQVYHTPNRQGHKTLIEQFGAALFESCSGDEDEKDRLLYGISSVDNEEENAAVCTVTSHKPHLQLLGKEVTIFFTINF